jgi:glutamyl-tRNA reductase
MNKTDTIDKIILLGFSHKTTPVNIREKFSFDENTYKKFSKHANKAGIDEIVYLSTCNRVEIYFTSRTYHTSINELTDLLEEATGLTKEIFSEYIYIKRSRDVILHLLTVASSLDSMVIGENEILGQVKQAFHNAVKFQNNGILLNKLFHQAFNTAKKVKSRTAISQNLLSVASIAVEKIMETFNQDISGKNALLVGAGEMGELILKYLVKNKIGNILIANRTLDNAKNIADCIDRNVDIVHISEIESAAVEVDVIITSVAYHGYILSHQMLEAISAKRDGKPLFIIDIAVPRNVDPETSRIDGVTLYNIDDLKGISDNNLKNRLSEVDLAMEIIVEDVDELCKWYEGLEMLPMIVSMQESLEKIREQEFSRYKKRSLKHLSEDDLKIVEEMSRDIIAKILRIPIKAIKQNKELKLNGYHEGQILKEKVRIIEDLFRI